MLEHGVSQRKYVVSIITPRGRQISPSALCMQGDIDKFDSGRVAVRAGEFGSTCTDLVGERNSILMCWLFLWPPIHHLSYDCLLYRSRWRRSHLFLGSARMTIHMIDKAWNKLITVSWNMLAVIREQASTVEEGFQVRKGYLCRPCEARQRGPYVWNAHINVQGLLRYASDLRIPQTQNKLCLHELPWLE